VTASPRLARILTSCIAPPKNCQDLKKRMKKREMEPHFEPNLPWFVGGNPQSSEQHQEDMEEEEDERRRGLSVMMGGKGRVKGGMRSQRT